MTGLSSGSRKTRIETGNKEAVPFGDWRLSSGSRKTRIETEKRIMAIICDAVSLSSGSRKTRIETLLLFYLFTMLSSLSSGSRKTRIETEISK